MNDGVHSESDCFSKDFEWYERTFFSFFQVFEKRAFWHRDLETTTMQLSSRKIDILIKPFVLQVWTQVYVNSEEFLKRTLQAKRCSFFPYFSKIFSNDRDARFVWKNLKNILQEPLGFHNVDSWCMKQNVSQEKNRIRW